MISHHDNPGAARSQSDLIAYVVRHVVCEDCGESYAADDVQVMLHADFQWDLVATCPICAAKRAVTAFDQPPYVRLRARVVPITLGEVQEWRDFLATYDGDLHGLLDYF